MMIHIHEFICVLHVIPHQSGNCCRMSWARVCHSFIACKLYNPAWKQLTMWHTVEWGLIPSDITALRPQRCFTASISCVNHHPVILNQSTATRWAGICYPHPIRLHHTTDFLLSCAFQLTIQNIFSMESKEWFSCFFYFLLINILYNLIYPLN